MKNRTPIFMVSPKTSHIAGALKTSFNIDNTVQPVQIDVNKNCFASLKSADDLYESVWEGHSDSSTFGGLKAFEFADKFNNDFNTKFNNEHDKRKVKHIYIISCETGSSIQQTNALAKDIANRLFDHGFENVAVHTITNPKNVSQDNVMRVNVTYKGGVDRKQGHIEASTIPAHAEQKIKQIREKKEKGWAKVSIAYDAFYRRTFLWVTSGIKAILGEKENTFYSDKRNPCVHRYVHPVREHAIQLIENRIVKSGKLINKKRNKIDDPKNKKLNNLIVGIESFIGSWDEYLKMLNDKILDGKNTKPFIESWDEYLKILNDKIVEDKKTKQMFIDIISEAYEARKAVMTSNVSHVEPENLDEHKRIIAEYEENQRKQQETSNNQKADKQQHFDINIDVNLAIAALKFYSNLLSREIKEHDQSCFACIYRFFGTKETKREITNTLEEEISNDRKNAASKLKAVLENTNFTSGFRSHRAEYLVRNLLAGNVKGETNKDFLEAMENSPESFKKRASKH